MYVFLSRFQNVADGVATADADPLGVDMNVTFDNVGGLDNRKLTFSPKPGQKLTFRYQPAERDGGSTTPLP